MPTANGSFMPLPTYQEFFENPDRYLQQLSQIVPMKYFMLVCGYLYYSRDEARETFERISRTQSAEVYHAAVMMYRHFVRNDIP